MNDEITDDQILGSILQQRLKLSIKAIQLAKDTLWDELPADEKRTYLQLAERAVLASEEPS